MGRLHASDAPALRPARSEGAVEGAVEPSASGGGATHEGKAAAMVDADRPSLLEPSLLVPPVPPQAIVDKDDAASKKAAAAAPENWSRDVAPVELVPPLPPQMIVDDAAQRKVAAFSVDGAPPINVGAGDGRVSDPSLAADAGVGPPLPPNQILSESHSTALALDVLSDRVGGGDSGEVANDTAGAANRSRSPTPPHVADATAAVPSLRPPPPSMMPSAQVDRQETLPSDVPFYAVTATLVKESRRRTVYDAVAVSQVEGSDGADDKPWWRRRAILAMGAVIVALAVVVGVLLTSSSGGSGKEEGNEDTASSAGNVGSSGEEGPSLAPAKAVPPTGTSLEDLAPVPMNATQSPTASPITGTPTGQPQPVVPAPCISSITFEKTLFEFDEFDSQITVAIRGDTAIVSKNEMLYVYNGTSLAEMIDDASEIGYRNPHTIVVSKDANTAFVGVPDVDDGTGAVYVFRRRYDDPNVWWKDEPFSEEMEGRLPSPIYSNAIGYGARFGHALALDGDVLVVGANKHVFAYRRDDNNWVEEARLNAMVFNWDSIGKSVAIKGNLAAAAGRVSGEGELVFLFEYIPRSNRWILLGHRKPVGCDGGFNAESLAFTEDGELLVGCPDPGVIYYYVREGAGFGAQYTLVQNITTSSNAAIGYEGQMAVEGDIMVVGSGNGRGLSVFALEGDMWTEVATMDTPEGSSNHRQVALSGNRVLVASDSNVYSYTLNEC